VALSTPTLQARTQKMASFTTINFILKISNNLPKTYRSPHEAAAVILLQPSRDLPLCHESRFKG